MNISKEELTVRLKTENFPLSSKYDPHLVIENQMGPNVLWLTEEEILTTPCLCLCCYNVESTIVDLLPGNYVIDYCWYDYEEDGEVCHREEVEIGWLLESDMDEIRNTENLFTSNCPIC